MEYNQIIDQTFQFVPFSNIMKRGKSFDINDSKYHSSLQWDEINFHDSIYENSKGTKIIYSGTIERDDHIKKVCMKKYFITKKTSIHCILNEVYYLYLCQSENVIELYDFYIHYENDNIHSLYIIMEKGKKFEYFYNNELSSMTYDEKIDIIKQMAYSIKSCHDKRVCHRDITLNNFVIIKNGDDIIVKIIDFGRSCKIMNYGDKIRGQYTTASYQSYEMKNSLSYTIKTDIWSFGICMYYIITYSSYSIKIENKHNMFMIIPDEYKEYESFIYVMEKIFCLDDKRVNMSALIKCLK